MLTAIARGSRTVTELADKFGISRTSVNYAIRKLANAGLIDVEYKMIGTNVIKYCVPKYSQIVIDLIGDAVERDKGNNSR